MKKLFVLLLSVLMCLSLAGCSGGGGEKTSDEPSVITLDMSTLFIVPNLEATQTVEDAINNYLENELHETYRIHLKITSIGDYLQKIPMELASGGDDTADVVQVFDVANWADNGYIIPLDEYADNELKPTLDLIGDVVNNGKVDGQIFMVPRYFGTVLDWKWIYNKQMVEDAGIDVSKITDLDTLGDALAELKVKYPDEYFLVYCNQFDRILQPKTKTAQVGTYTATVGDSTQLVNYYETDAFKDAIYKAYDFRQKGYADPEGSANTLSHDAVVMGGASKGVIMGHSNDCDSIAQMFTQTADYGDGETHEFGAVTIAMDDKATDTLGIGISHSCKDPAAAARFINLLYTDQFIWDALIFGAEGQDYEWNEDHTKIRYPEGMDFNTVPYNCMYSCGMIGNGFDFFLEYESGNETGSNGEYGKYLFENAATPPLYGFVPVNTNVANEIAAVSNVVDQYTNVLTYGDVNPDEQYPLFLQALKDAGIDKIVADYQAQADAWVKANS